MALEVRVIKGAEKRVAEVLGRLTSNQHPEIHDRGEAFCLTFTEIDDVPEFVRTANALSGVSTIERKPRKERKT